MSSKAMSLKAQIKNYAKDSNIAAQVILQNYMFERFLERMSKSEYRDKFVIKGGMLIAAIAGLDTRSTMDLDTTLKDLPLTETEVMEAVKSICCIDLGDEVSFKTVSVVPIRKDDKYGGFCVRLNAVYDTIVTPLSIDVSAGDVITPGAVQYEFCGIFNTRPRDYYDIFILATTQRYDEKIFKEALEATAIHRGSLEKISDTKSIIEMLSNSEELKEMWLKYQKKICICTGYCICANYGCAEAIGCRNDIGNILKRIRFCWVSYLQTCWSI